MKILIGIGIIIGLIYNLRLKFQKHLKEMEKNDNKYRRYLKDRYRL